MGDDGGLGHGGRLHRQIRVGESGGKPQAAEALAHEIVGDLLVFQWPAQDVAEHCDQAGVGESLRAGQRDALAEEFVGEQGPRRDLGDVAVGDRGCRRRRVRSADHIACLELRAPHAQEVGGEDRRTQTHPLKPGACGVLLYFFVPVATEPGWLAREVVVAVDGGERDEAGNSFPRGLIHEPVEIFSQCARIQENCRDSVQPSTGRRDGGDLWWKARAFWMPGDRADVGPRRDQ